ncbi:unnamed protein product [Ectocarpus sp. 4 AP-2014]
MPKTFFARKQKEKTAAQSSTNIEIPKKKKTRSRRSTARNPLPHGRKPKVTKSDTYKHAHIAPPLSTRSYRTTRHETPKDPKNAKTSYDTRPAHRRPTHRITTRQQHSHNHLSRGRRRQRLPPPSPLLDKNRTPRLQPPKPARYKRNTPVLTGNRPL